MQCNDLIVTMMHNRYEEDVNLLCCPPLFSCHCVYIIMKGERGRDKEAAWRQVNQIMLRAHQRGRLTDGCVFCLYSQDFVTVKSGYFSSVSHRSEWPWTIINPLASSLTPPQGRRFGFVLGELSAGHVWPWKLESGQCDPLAFIYRAVW